VGRERDFEVRGEPRAARKGATPRVHFPRRRACGGCGDMCPMSPSKRYLDWDLPDPAGLGVEEVRPIRNEIGRRVAALLVEMDGARAVRRRGAWRILRGDGVNAGCSCGLVPGGVAGRAVRASVPGSH
jgi:hypothetical protein